MEAFALLCVALLGQVVGVRAARILVYSASYSTSHLVANGRMADELAKAGHNVVMFIPEVTPTEYNATKLAKIIRMPLKSTAFMDMFKILSTGLFDKHVLGFRERRLFENAATEACDEILTRQKELDALRAYDFQIGFSEQLEFCGVGLIRMLGIPNHIWISSCTLMESIADPLGIPAPPSYVPATEENDLGTVMSFLERFRNFYLWIMSAYLYRRGGNMITERFRERVSPQFPHLRDVAKESAMVFANSDEFLDVPRPISHKVVYIGGFGIEPKPHPLNQKFESLMAKGQKGVVVFSFGTVVPSSSFPANVRRDIFRVFADFSDYHFIMKVDPTDSEIVQLAANLPNVDLVHWFPQSDLLGDTRVRLFIMHGGFYGLTEAATRGVPVLVIPFFADQFRNARAAQSRGIGFALQKYDITYVKLKAAVSELLGNDKYAIAARRLSSLIRNKPNKPLEQLLRWTDFVARYGLLPELQLEGANLNVFSYFCVDVLLASLAILILFASMAVVVARFALQSLRKRHLLIVKKRA